MSTIEFIRIYELDRERSARTRPNPRPITLPALVAMPVAPAADLGRAA